MLDEDAAEASAEDLTEAARRLNLVLIGQPVRSYFSYSSKASRDGEDYWLRLRRFETATWDESKHLGYEESSAVHGVPKPVIADRVVWQGPAHLVRAELLTHIGEPIVSSSIHLKSMPELPESWWASLHEALENLGGTPTDRDTANVLGDTAYLRGFYGVDLPEPTDWTAEHEDPHWNNLTGPRLHILDWDYWGRQPRGFTVAGLFCTSLGVPEISDRLWREFADVMEAPSGKWSVLYHIWYRRKGMPSFLAWERGAAVARDIIRDLT